MWMITITHYINRGFEIESEDKFGKIFSTKENAEKWLVKEGFVYGKNDCFKPADKPYWFHQQDDVDDFVQVDFGQIEPDSDHKEPWITSLRYRK